MARNHSTHSAAWSITLSTTESDKNQDEPSVVAVAPPPHHTHERPYTTLLEFAALLLAVSLAVAISGAAGHHAPRASGLRLALSVATAADGLCGLVGLALAMRVLGAHAFERYVARVGLGVQAAAGAYAVFVPYVYVPSMRAWDAPTVPGFSATEARIVLIAGAAARLSGRLALLGAQCSLLARMLDIVCDKKTTPMLLQTLWRGAILWHANCAVAGLCTAGAAAFVVLVRGLAVLPVELANVLGVCPVPGVAMFVGSVMFLWGVTGVSLMVLRSRHMAHFASWAVLLYVLALLNTVVFQYDENAASSSYVGAAADVGVAFAHGTLLSAPARLGVDLLTLRQSLLDRSSCRSLFR